jgi:succinate dehydrogenase / fumarate reductase flavoprotein subunit/fumarate reductase flavoprotein subunit
MYKIAAPSLEKAGDGVAMAWRAGARLMDLEMMQFHPTGLLAGPSRLTGSVLEEGLRGAGAHLRNALGERYMARYDPERMERATRDVVSRSSYLEIAGGRGTSNGGVWIDVSHLGRAEVIRQFPGMVERCRAVGRDLSAEPVEVSPTAHFHMGGIAITPDCRTSLEGLFAAGEDSAGVHGANRLGGNGVAESIVFGARAGDAVAAYVAGRDLPPADESFAAAVAAAALAPLRRERGEDAFALRKRLGELTWERVGLVRDGRGLEEALAELDDLYDRTGRIAVNPELRLNGEWQQALDVRNLVEVARLIARAALIREESRGSHFRADFPAPDDDRWLKNILLRRSAGGEAEVDLRPAVLTRLRPPAPARA